MGYDDGLAGPPDGEERLDHEGMEEKGGGGERTHRGRVESYMKIAV